MLAHLLLKIYKLNKGTKYLFGIYGLRRRRSRVLLCLIGQCLPAIISSSLLLYIVCAQRWHVGGWAWGEFPPPLSFRQQLWGLGGGLASMHFGRKKRLWNVVHLISVLVWVCARVGGVRCVCVGVCVSTHPHTLRLHLVPSQKPFLRRPSSDLTRSTYSKNEV